MKNRLLYMMLWAASFCAAQNPIVPAGVYIADPSAHVWNDGRLYVYGSLDESPEYYCSTRHHVLMTEDMNRWQIFENIFASAGPNDQVPQTDAPLYAPDCMFRNGIYFLYYCTPDPHHAAGRHRRLPARGGAFLDRPGDRQDRPEEGRFLHRLSRQARSGRS